MLIKNVFQCFFKKNQLDLYRENELSKVETNMRTLSFHSLSQNTKNTYHNKRHVTDVVNFSKEILRIFHVPCTSIEHKVVVYAAYLHDIYHPANNTIDLQLYYTNLTKTCCDEIKNLEDFHARISTYILETQIYDHEISTSPNAKHLIYDLILSTGLKTYSYEDPHIEREKLKCILRCADLCHFTFATKLHKEYSLRLMTEMNVSVNPIENVQFIDKFVIPTYEKLFRFHQSYEIIEYINRINVNRLFWVNLSNSDLFNSIGGEPIILKILDVVYEKIIADDRINYMFHNKDLETIKIDQYNLIKTTIKNVCITYEMLEDVRALMNQLTFTHWHFDILLSLIVSSLESLQIDQLLIKRIEYAIVKYRMVVKAV